jgi:hypothetical protein
MPTTKESWDQVGESWRDLGRHLCGQYQKLSEEQAQETREDRAKLNEAASQLTEHVGEALRSVGELAKEPETKQSLDRVIRAMGEAISATFDAAADEIRERLPGREGADPPKVAGAPNAGGSVTASSE